MTDFLENIEQRLSSQGGAALSASEARVGRWIVQNPQVAAAATLTEVATAAQVSEPTVIRFCRSMGLRGFRDARLRLVAGLQRSRSYFHANVAADDDIDEAAIKVIEQSIRAIVDLRGQVKDLPLQRVVSVMAKARQLVFMGIGASGIVAEDAQHKFFRLGIPCSVERDSQTILQRAAIAEAQDVYIVISTTGDWPVLKSAMANARARGAWVVVLTAPDSELAQYADFTLPCEVLEDTSTFTPMSSRLAQLTLLDALQVGLALEIGPEAERYLRESKAVLSKEVPSVACENELSG